MLTTMLADKPIVKHLYVYTCNIPSLSLVLVPILAQWKGGWILSYMGYIGTCCP